MQAITSLGLQDRYHGDCELVNDVANLPTMTYDRA